MEQNNFKNADLNQIYLNMKWEILRVKDS